eukprot:COSAG04_NODE_372_length_15668_cov_11.135975_18_plen_58_part_00
MVITLSRAICGPCRASFSTSSGLQPRHVKGCRSSFGNVSPIRATRQRFSAQTQAEAM